MKNIFKRIIISGVLVLTFGVFSKVNAQAELSFSNPVKNGDTTSVNVKMKYLKEDGIKSVQFKCDSGSLDVKCNISWNQEFFGKADGSDGVFIQLSDDKFKDDGIILATLNLKNTTTSQLNNIKLTVKNIKINKDSGTDELQDTDTNYSVGVSKVVSADATIKEMTISQGAISPAWDPATKDYVIYNIADTINSIRFNHTCAGNGCTVKYEGGKSVAGSQVSLNVGENNVTLLVTAEDGKTTDTYNFKIYRGESSFNSSKLNSLSIGTNKLDPEFNKDVTEYKVTVANDVNSLKDLIQYELIDTNASVDEKGLENLVVGENTVTITVTSSLGDNTTEYKIVVNRMDNEEIEVLKYIDGKITFKDSKGEEQTLTLSEFKSKYPVEYKKIVNKTYRFDDEGNIIKEEVKEKKKGLSKTTILILIIVGGLAIIGVAGFFIFKKPSDKSKKKDKKNTKKEVVEEKQEEVVEKEENEEKKEIGNDFSDDEDTTVSIDVALNDLMNTKQYEFDKTGEIETNDEKEEK